MRSRLNRWAVLLLALLAFEVHAQPAGSPERPWAKGVPQAKQDQAIALFRDGNSALKESLLVKAAQLFREALQAWDHPAIHYNLALALLSLDQPVETHQHLTAALKYGAAPLDADKHEQALRYRAVVEKQLAKVEIRCPTAGAVVKLDGVQIFLGPGSHEALVRAGTHTVVASKEGFLTSEQSDTLSGGASRLFELKLKSAEDLTEYRRRWSPVMPWTVLGAGAALIAAGAGLHVSARDTFRAYDRGVTACAGARTSGCVPSVSLASARAQGETLQGFAMAGYTLGGAALVTGAVLVYLNRPTPYRTSVGITLAPLLGPAPGATLFVEF